MKYIKWAADASLLYEVKTNGSIWRDPDCLHVHVCLWVALPIRTCMDVCIESVSCCTL